MLNPNPDLTAAKASIAEAGKLLDSNYNDVADRQAVVLLQKGLASLIESLELSELRAQMAEQEAAEIRAAAIGL